MDTVSLMVEALEHLGVDARSVDRAGDADMPVDLVLVDPDGVALVVELKRRALVDEPAAERLLRGHRPAAGTLLVVADRVTDAAREVLSAPGAGYYDLRGRVALRGPGLVVNADVPAITERPQRAEALSGKAGLEVATALLNEPERHVSVRELARGLGRSASTVSNILAALRREQLIDATNVVVDTSLFWRVAERWPSTRTHLARVPSSSDQSVAAPLRFGTDVATNPTGWALTKSAAAAAYGAPIAVRSNQVLDFIVPDESALRRAANLLGAGESPMGARATVRVAPVPEAVRHRVDPTDHTHQWPLARPLFVALDLAQDRGRGREILEAWTPPEPWPRVW